MNRQSFGQSRQHSISVMLTLLLAVCVSARADDPDQAEQPDGEAQKKAPMTTAEYMERFPLEERIRRVTEAAENGMVFGDFATPEWLMLLTSEKAVLAYLGRSEPFSDEWLDALEAVLARDRFDEARFRAAMLLFRHGRDAGRAHLLEVMRQDFGEQAEHAAWAFAVAQEPGTEKAVVDAVLKLFRRRDLLHVYDALARWDSDELDEELSRPEVRQALNPSPALYARITGSVMNEGMRAELNRIISDNSPRYGASAKMRCAGVLVRKDPDDAEARQFLMDQLAERPNGWVFRGIIETRDPQFIEPLLETISRLLQPQEGETRDMANTRPELISYAVEAVVHLGGDVPPELVSQIYGDNAGTYQRTELALLQTRNPEALKRMRERLGEEEVERLMAIQQLKPVPDSNPYFYVPYTSRGWVWY